jgi:hypothetical protein
MSDGVTHYRIMRRIDDSCARTGSDLFSNPDSSCYSTEDWERIEIIDADFSEQYSVTLPTHSDGPPSEGNWAVFYVIADRQDVSYYSCPDSGLSIDDATATVLESFGAYYDDNAIRIEWKLIGEGPESGFLAMKSEGNDYFGYLNQGIIRDKNGLYFLLDENIEPGKTYRYRIVYNEEGMDRIPFGTEEIVIPYISAWLSQNAPNPFNPSTTISYNIAAASEVRLDVYDANGKLVRKLVSGSLPAGSYTAKWDGRSDNGSFLSSGVYFCRLQAGKDSITIKMILLK